MTSKLFKPQNPDNYSDEDFHVRGTRPIIDIYERYNIIAFQPLSNNETSNNEEANYYY